MWMIVQDKMTRQGRTASNICPRPGLLNWTHPSVGPLGRCPRAGARVESAPACPSVARGHPATDRPRAVLFSLFATDQFTNPDSPSLGPSIPSPTPGPRRSIASGARAPAYGARPTRFRKRSPRSPMTASYRTRSSAMPVRAGTPLRGTAGESALFAPQRHAARNFGRRHGSETARAAADIACEAGRPFSVSLSCRPRVTPAGIPKRLSSSSLPPSFAPGRCTTGFLPADATTASALSSGAAQ